MQIKKKANDDKKNLQSIYIDNMMLGEVPYMWFKKDAVLICLYFGPFLFVFACILDLFRLLYILYCKLRYHYKSNTLVYTFIHYS